MADAIFDDSRLAQVYDPLDPDRSDLDVYVALVDELAVRSVLDIAAAQARSRACSRGGASR